MKKLRLFDSLKIMRAMFVAVVVATFILNVAHAATTTINSVIAYGKTEQSGTPTPTNPVPIMTNNGVLKVSPNLFDETQLLSAGWTLDSSGYYTGSFARFLERFRNGFTFSQPFKENTQYTLTCNGYASGSALRFIVRYTDGSSKNWDINTRAAKDYVFVSEAGKTISRIEGSYGSGSYNGFLKDVKVMEGTSADGIYADGLTETIRDSAGHTATAQMLLSVGDYKDEQNITTGAITRKVGVKVLDGVSTGAKATSVNINQGKYYAVCGGQTNITATTTDLLSTHFKAGAFASGYDIVYAVATNIVLVNSNQSLTTVDLYNQWLADQYAAGTPVIVVYPLETETTESVATQTLNTAPVRQTAGSILGMPIEVVLGDGTREWVSEMITIATTRYNEERFAPVKTDLSAAVNAVEYVVSNTMTQAQQIDQIATSKQTRPDEGCTAKYCLLIEDENGTPHWYPIAGANGVAHNLPTGYTELQYIESTGTQRINTGITGDVVIDTEAQQTHYIGSSQVLAVTTTNGVGGTYFGTTETQEYWGFSRGSTGMSNVLATTKAKIQITFNSSGASGTVNGENIARSASVTQGTLYIFASSNAQFGGYFKLWSMRIYQNGNLVRNFIPARHDADNGKLGLYDMVSGQFFTNAGTGNFVAGPDM